MPADLAGDVLSGFDMLLYRWNLLTDEMDWGPGQSAAMQATGLTAIRSGAALHQLRDDAPALLAWAQSAAQGDTARFVFSMPGEGAQGGWIEDRARRIDIGGVPCIAGMLSRLRPAEGAGKAGPLHEAERAGRARLLSHLAAAGTESDRSYILFGIDNLRDLNRALGPDVTDEIVTEVDMRIAAARPDGADYARVGSAKFALAEAGSGSQPLAVLVRRIMDRVGRSEIRSSVGPVTVSVSAGICHTPRGARLPSDPMANALIAYDEARIGRIEGMRFSRHGNGTTNLRDRYVSGARLVMDAIEEGRLTIAFQPIVRAEQPDAVAFNECLARIVDPNGDPVPAESFMPAIEHLGLIRQVDREVLRLALACLSAHPQQRLSVNLSPQSMNDSKWLAILEAGLAETPDAGDRLILEVTESSAMLDPGRTLAFMNRVRGLGPAFALDDFGAGYTSFKHFRDFRFDAVKIDGSFVGGIARNEDNQLLIRTLVSIAEHFSMFTVAEFVEAEADAAFLRSLGIDCLQGYLYGRPQLRPDWIEAARPRHAMQA